MKRTHLILTILVSLACLSIDGQRASATQTKEPKLPPEVSKLIRLKSLRLSKVKRVKGGFLIATFVPTGTQAAQIGFTCNNGKDFSISTGNDSGKCTVTTNSAGDVTSATCDDDHGNSASVSCSKGDGGTCTSTTGSGTCN
jgi:hypothetical protein